MSYGAILLFAYPKNRPFDTRFALLRMLFFASWA